MILTIEDPEKKIVTKKKELEKEDFALWEKIRLKNRGQQTLNNNSLMVICHEYYLEN